MSIISELLVKAVEDGASDIHLKSEQAPIFRISGTLTQSDFEELDDDAMNSIVHDIHAPARGQTV